MKATLHIFESMLYQEEENQNPGFYKQGGMHIRYIPPLNNFFRQTTTPPVWFWSVHLVGKKNHWKISRNS